MPSHIRLLLALVTVLVFSVVFSPPRRAQTQSLAVGRATLRAPVAQSHAKAGQCVDDAARHDHHAALDDAPEGEAFDSDVELLASGQMFAPVFGEVIETAHAAHGTHEFVFEGVPDNDVWATLLPPLLPAQTHEVRVGPAGEPFSFDPANLTIQVGDTVRWIWDSPSHTVTSGGSSCAADNIFCSPNNTNCASAPSSSTGFIYTRTFNTAGTFNYFCKVHCFTQGMTGTITVQAAASTFTISGKVATGEGAAVSGVTMTLSGATSATATTDASGNYSFGSLAAGNYTVTPSHVTTRAAPRGDAGPWQRRVRLLRR
jgi:plastocyanin